MTPEELRAVLEAAGRTEPPAPRAEFTSDLEARLTTTHVVTAPRTVRPRWQAAAFVGAAAAAIVAAVVFQPGEPNDVIVTDTTTTFSVTTTITVPVATTSTTTSTTAVVETTAASVPATTTTVAPTTTTTVAPTTTTTVAPTTTTTATPGVEDLRMACTPGPRPQVTCTWSASTSDAFEKYRLIKRVADGEVVEIGRSTTRDETTKTDTNVESGTRITYVIEAYDSNAVLIGRGEATVACC